MGSCSSSIAEAVLWLACYAHVQMSTDSSVNSALGWNITRHWSVDWHHDNDLTAAGKCLNFDRLKPALIDTKLRFSRRILCRVNSFWVPNFADSYFHRSQFSKAPFKHRILKFTASNFWTEGDENSNCCPWESNGDVISVLLRPRTTGSPFTPLHKD